MHLLKTPITGVTHLLHPSVLTSPRSTPHILTLEGLDSTWHSTLQFLLHPLHPSPTETESGTATQVRLSLEGDLTRRPTLPLSIPATQSEREGKGSTDESTWATETTADPVTTTHTTTAATTGIYLCYL